MLLIVTYSYISSIFASLGLLIAEFYIISTFFFGGATRHAGFLVPRPGIEPMPSAVETLSLNDWSAREVP